MKLKPIKQIMNNKITLEALAQEVHLHKLSVQTRKFKLSDAREIAKEQMKSKESDPYLFTRIVSGLMNGSLTPRDFSRSHK